MANAGIVEEKHNWQYTDETRGAIKCECEECQEKANSTEGRTLSVGQEIAYQVERENKTGEVGTRYASLKTATDVKLIIAETGAKESQVIAQTTITAEQSGYTEEQTITLTEEPKWVVFGFEDRNKNGTNETLLLTTLEPTSGTIIFKGAAGYNNGIEQINRMCRELYGKDARGMTIEDVNRVVGYTPPETAKVSDYIPLEALQELHNTYSNGVFYTPAHPEGIKDNGVELGNYKADRYYYYKRELTSIADSSKNLIFGFEGKAKFWLASVSCLASPNEGACFGPAVVFLGEVCPSWYCLYSIGFDVGDEVLSLPLRSVVSLTSDVPEAGEMLVKDYPYVS